MRLGYTCAPTRTSVGGAKMRIAVLSDIHGNLPALEAILADVARRGVDHVVNQGDHVSGPLMPAETAQFLMRQPWTQINGNHDRELATSDPADLIPSDAFARAQLGGEALEWLAGLPPSSTVNDGGLLLHGTIRRDTEYLLETIENGAARLATPAEIEVRLGEAQAEVMLCGHSHIPRSVRTLSGQLIVNPGSVGLPAFTDVQPFPHKVETGSPDARYAIVERTAAGWTAQLLTVPYDHRPMAALARERHRPSWEQALCTGYVDAPR